MWMWIRFEKGSKTCGELVDEIALAQPTISKHLKELKSVGIINGTIEGTSQVFGEIGTPHEYYDNRVESGHESSFSKL